MYKCKYRSYIVYIYILIYTNRYSIYIYLYIHIYIYMYVLVLNVFFLIITTVRTPVVSPLKSLRVTPSSEVEDLATPKLYFRNKIHSSGYVNVRRVVHHGILVPMHLNEETSRNAKFQYQKFVTRANYKHKD